jgi:hypothetical protein
VLDAQRRLAVFDGDQAVDVGCLPDIGACVVGVLGENFQAFFGCIDIDRTIGLRQMVVDRQRTLAARLVFDGGDDMFSSLSSRLTAARWEIPGSFFRFSAKDIYFHSRLALTRPKMRPVVKVIPGTTKAIPLMPRSAPNK